MKEKLYLCPNCKKKVDSKSKYFPFCSEKCSLSDMYNWLEERYKIEGEAVSFKNGSLIENKEEENE